MKRNALMYLAIVTVCLFSGGLALSIQDTEGQNQTGPGINERSEFQIGLCRGLGGIDTVTTVRTPASSLAGVKVICKGGLLGGMTCFNDPKSTFCVWARAGQTVPDNVRPADAVDFLDLPLLTEFPASAEAALTPEVAEQPMLVEAVVTWNASPTSAQDQGLAQVNGCRHLGGEAIVTGPVADDPQIVSVQCEGGMLDGLWCTNGTGPGMCFFLPTAETGVETSESPVVTPAAVQVQATEAMPTEAPTEAAPSPSPTATVPSMPTEAPTEPTLVPTSADGGWTPPDVETLPPLEPAPSPTEAPFN